MSYRKPRKPRDEPEVLPPEDELPPPPEPASFGDQEDNAVGRKSERRSYKEKKEEESERVALLRILGEYQHKGQKLDAKTSETILTLFDKSRHREMGRAVDLLTSQRQYLYFLAEHNKSLAAQQTATQNAVLENINKIGDLTKSLGEASGKSKMSEIVELIPILSQVPIVKAVMDMAVEWMQKKNNKLPKFKGQNARENTKRYMQLRKQLREMEEEANTIDADDPDSYPEPPNGPA